MAFVTVTPDPSAAALDVSVSDSPVSAVALAQNQNYNALANRTGKCNYTAGAAPLPTDDAGSGYGIHSLWLYSGILYVCLDPTASAAVWVAYAPLASPAFTGTPTAPTAAGGTNTTQLATTAFVLANAPGAVLTGYTSGAGTVGATDSILQAIGKLNGNDATNANLTGPITSTGNATSIASQTGDGETFVMDDSPTIQTSLTTPLIYGSTTSGGVLTIAATSNATAGNIFATANIFSLSGGYLSFDTSGVNTYGYAFQKIEVESGNFHFCVYDADSFIFETTVNGTAFTTRASISKTSATFNVPVNPNIPPTPVSGSTSGTANFYDVMQGSALKKTIVQTAALVGTASHTFATAFTAIPKCTSGNGVNITSLSTTSMTITGATDTDTYILEGN